MIIVFSIAGSMPSLMAQMTNTGDLTILPETQIGVVGNFNNTTEGTVMNDGEFFLYSSFNNEGTIDHNNNGMTRFVGSSPQAISGTNVSYFYNVLFDNTSSQPTFELSGELSIANEADFNQGIVDNNNYGGSYVFEQFA